ncbi:alpha/beta hydrolase [Polaribacter sp. Asnod1-A03]|uniref:alpha/beta hydrolase n=1 Tax=Polaribacter sp. Asnod1-A03 TaxID=3160581 RepID=UPI003868BAC6
MSKYLIITFLFLFTVTIVNGQKKVSKNTFDTIPQRVIYKIINADTLKMDIYKPFTFKKKKKYPTIVFFFGGGWNGGTITQFEPQAKYFASRGMVTVLVDYRVKNKHKTTPFEAVNDAKSAIRFLREHAKEYTINPNKIVASGGSAGGHLAAATALLSGLEEKEEDLTISSKANALVLYNPVIDNSEKGYGYDRVGTRYLEISPMHNIKKGAPPTLFMLGSKDVLIPESTAYLYQDKMEAINSRCDVIIYDGQGHGFFNQWKKEGLEYYKRTTIAADKFLQSIGYLKGKATL